MIKDLPAPVSPVRAVKPASNSRVTSSAKPKFLMRSAVSMGKRWKRGTIFMLC